MNKYFKIFLLLVFCFMLCGCSKLNPFASPDNTVSDKSSDKKVDKYMDSVDKDIDKKDKIIDKKTDNIEKNYSDKTNSIYNNAMDKYLDDSSEIEDDPFKATLKAFYVTYCKIRLFTPAILISSIVIGTLGIRFSRHNKNIRRWFLITWIIVIPILTLFVVFGVGTLNGIFLNA